MSISHFGKRATAVAEGLKVSIALSNKPSLASAYRKRPVALGTCSLRPAAFCSEKPAGFMTGSISLHETGCFMPTGF